MVTRLRGDDVLLCQITSQAVKDSYAVYIEEKDFEAGSLKQPSHARPNRLFTAEAQIILYQVGRLKKEKMDEIVKKIVEIVQT